MTATVYMCHSISHIKCKKNKQIDDTGASLVEWPYADVLMRATCQSRRRAQVLCVAYVFFSLDGGNINIAAEFFN